MSFDQLGQVLGATDEPPTMLVLNACDSLGGADVVLPTTPVVIGMKSDISDLASSVFAARFYAAIASGQSVRSAMAQGSLAVDLSDLREGWKPDSVVRAGIELGELILVQPVT